ncbi:MAG: hypothetical protein LBE91_15000 [Tannerella sp.]|jgi:hypothetical protein|nr:hypothetical protein [Tannerella sp.]
MMVRKHNKGKQNNNKTNYNVNDHKKKKNIEEKKSLNWFKLWILWMLAGLVFSYFRNESFLNLGYLIYSIAGPPACYAGIKYGYVG